MAPRAWENAIRAKANEQVFKKAWRKGQKIRTALEKATSHVFQEVATASIDVLSPPDLASASVDWAPLSDNWIARKGFDEFYYNTGELYDSLVKKDSQEQRIFGRPQVFLDFEGKSLQVTAAPPAKTKYNNVDMSKLMFRIIPFPKLNTVQWGDAEGLTFSEGSKDWWKIMAYHRWMLTPFFRWWIRVRVRREIKRVIL